MPLVTQTSPWGQRYTVNSAAAPSFANFLTGLSAMGYQAKSVQGYNYRNIAGTNTLSEHSKGLAIDIDPGANALGSGLGAFTPNVNQLAAANGLRWGAGFGSNNDPMHFQYQPDMAGYARPGSALANALDGNSQAGTPKAGGPFGKFEVATGSASTPQSQSDATPQSSSDGTPIGPTAATTAQQAQGVTTPMAGPWEALGVTAVSKQGIEQSAATLKSGEAQASATKELSKTTAETSAQEQGTAVSIANAGLSSLRDILVRFSLLLAAVVLIAVAVYFLAKPEVEKTVAKFA